MCVLCCWVLPCLTIITAPSPLIPFPFNPHTSLYDLNLGSFIKISRLSSLGPYILQAEVIRQVYDKSLRITLLVLQNVAFYPTCLHAWLSTTTPSSCSEYRVTSYGVAHESCVLRGTSLRLHVGTSAYFRCTTPDAQLD